jgi:hypothetical protein
MDEYLDALERAKVEQTHWTIAINSPIVVYRGKSGRWDRWGVFRPIGA